MPQHQSEVCFGGRTDVPPTRTGQRFGLMEQDSIISHGAALFIHERLLEEPYPYNPMIRGHIHLSDNNENQLYTGSPITH